MKFPHAALAAGAIAFAACSSSAPTEVVADLCRPTTLAATATDSVTAAGRWNSTTSAIVARRERGPLGIARTFSLVSIAEYNAIAAANASATAGAPQSELGAAAGAAAAVLAAIYPAEQAAIDSRTGTESAAVTALSAQCATAFAAGVATGQQAAAAVLARAATDGSNAVWTGTLPSGPGYWIPAPPPAQPLSPLWGQVRPWFMTSGQQFRPVPPPALGTSVFTTALDEVRQFAAGRTPAQLATAQYWGNVVATSGPAGIWSQMGLQLAANAQLNEIKTARALAMMHIASMDATIGCWDAKYFYSYIRPFQVDTTITTPVGRPNFPSYPSAHSCVSAAYATVLTSLFPSAAADLEAKVQEAGISRIYAGLHYRFDVTTGQDIGRGAAGLAVARMPAVGTPISLE